MKYTEQDIQIQVNKFLRIYRRPEAWFWHTNNNPKSGKDGARLKQMGLTRGIADILCLAPDRGFFSLELKSEKGRPTPEQIDWQNYVRYCGFYSDIVYGYDQAVERLKLWGLVKGA